MGRKAGLAGVLAAALAAGAARADSAGAFPPPGFAWKSGNWYQSAGAAAYTGLAQAVSVLYCYAQPIPFGGRGVQALGSYFSAGDTSKKIAWVIYADAGGFPGVQIGRTAATAQVVSGSVSQTLTSGPFSVGSPGVWTCETQDGTSILNSLGDANFNGASTQGSANVAGATALGSTVSGLSCVVGGSCGSGVAWAGGVVTLPSDLTTGVTWTVVYASSHTIPTIAMQAR